MNKIKFICCLSLYFCFIIFISTLHICFVYKVIIFALIASFLVAYYAISIFTKSYSDFIFGTFIQIIFKELPPKDIESLIINNVFLTKYNHTFNSIDQIQNDILTFAENNFSKESINIIEKAIEKYLDIIKNLESYINTKSIKRMTTKDILQKNLRL
ncbi:hypothetical protein FMM75_24280 [Lachnospiraceae bacterium MD335]|nr:hypothetical protein [Lachnospiraceae bacterium MD335]